MVQIRVEKKDNSQAWFSFVYFDLEDCQYKDSKTCGVYYDDMTLPLYYGTVISSISNKGSWGFFWDFDHIGI